MKFSTFNPFQILPLQRVFECAGKSQLIFSATLFSSMESGELVLPTKFFKEIDGDGDAQESIDAGWPKSHSEFGVSGSFFAPAEEKCSASEVMVAVGKLKKRLLVFGERTWQGGLPTGPADLTSLPLNYDYAFGGQDYPMNPRGIGFGEERLPQIEYEVDLMTSPNARPNPAGFGVVNEANPSRTRFLGSYGGDYLKNDFPGFPADLDWRAFMTTAPDQWQEHFFDGDERFVLSNMNPDQPQLSGHLPGVRARVFVKRKTRPMREGTDLEEVALNLDTVWFYPTQKLLKVTFRGGLEVADDEATELSHAMYAYERLEDARKSVDHYARAFEKRLLRNDPLADFLDPSDLMPTGAAVPIEILQHAAKTEATTAPLAENLEAKARELNKLAADESERARQQIREMEDDFVTEFERRSELDQMIDGTEMRSADKETEALKSRLEGILPGVTGSTGGNQGSNLKDFSFDKVDEMMSAVFDYTESKKAQAMEMARPEIEKSIVELKDKLREHAVSMSDKQKDDLQSAIALLQDTLDGKAPQAVLPRVNSKELIEKLKQFSPQLTEQMQALNKLNVAEADPAVVSKAREQLEEMLRVENNAIHEQICRAETSFKESYALGAAFLDHGLPPHEFSQEQVRADFLERIRDGVDVAGGDWACIDLSGQALDGLDLSEAYLEQVDFTGASLRNANLSGAIMCRAVLEQCDLSGANLSKANIGGVRANSANFTGANLAEAELSRGDFSHANFSDATLTEIRALEVCIDQAQFFNAELDGFQLIEIPLCGTQFDGASLESAVFINTPMTDVSFDGANLHKSVFVGVGMVNAKLENANLSSACFVKSEDVDTSLSTVSFARSNLERCNLQGMNLSEADLSYSTLEYASLMEADLQGANLSHAQARGASFRKSNLQRANLNKINLPEGLLSKADLSGASFRGANLYATDFLQSTIGDTDFFGANLDATLIQDWRPS